MTQTTIFEFEDDDEAGPRCDKCGASMKSYWFRLTPGLVKSLIKAYYKMVEKRSYIIHKKELALSNSEYGNFQKLRVFGLIAKYREHGVWQRGTWVITGYGSNFVKGNLSIPCKIRVFRNKIVERSHETTNIHEVMRGHDWFQKDFETKTMRRV